MQDIADYVSVLDESDIKYSTFNRYITHMHTFLQFLKMKNIEVLKFYPERFLKKGFSEHNERSVPEKTIAHLIKELPAFPEHLQLMYLILFCTGIRKSEVCTIKSGAFYSQGNENWMRIYQSKMRREKVIPVPSLLVGLVNDYEKKYGIKNGEYLFKNKKGGAFNGQTFSNQMIRECKVRGIACGDYIFRAHDYRHNLATSMYGNGVSIQGVRDYLGHSSENMTKQYIDFMPERIVSAEDKYFSKNQVIALLGGIMVGWMMKGNINLISYDCYQQATEKQLAGLKWKENRVYYISEIHNEKMQDEIYGYIDDRCRRLSLSTVVNDIYRFDLLKEFLNEKCTSCSSITDKKWEELERSYKKGLALYVRRNRPDRRSDEQQNSAQVSFLKMYYEYVVKCKTADIPENEKDVWDMRKLDIVPRSNPIRGRYRLDFREIRQKEFKEIIKKILYSHCQTKAMGSIKGELRGFRRFASFMYDRFPEVKHFTEISRDMIEERILVLHQSVTRQSCRFWIICWMK